MNQDDHKIAYSIDETLKFASDDEKINYLFNELFKAKLNIDRLEDLITAHYVVIQALYRAIVDEDAPEALEDFIEYSANAIANPPQNELSQKERARLRIIADTIRNICTRLAENSTPTFEVIHGGRVSNDKPEPER